MPDIARYYDDSISVDSSVITPRFKIVLCELHNPAIHGFDENSDPEVPGHYLIHSKYDSIISSDNSDNSDYSDEEDEYDCDIYDVMHEFKRHIRRNIVSSRQFSSHPFIRNYKAIVSNENYIKPEIAECVYLLGDECVAILKTFWLRLVQRAWKRVFAERRQVFSQRMRPDSLRHRETMGKWPSSCSKLPGLHGMLYQKPKIL
jgi:hypothetical protein